MDLSDGAEIRELKEGGRALARRAGNHYWYHNPQTAFLSQYRATAKPQADELHFLVNTASASGVDAIQKKKNAGFR